MTTPTTNNNSGSRPLLTPRQMRRARRLISQESYPRLRLMQLRVALRNLDLEYCTYAAELGGEDNIDPDIYEWYVRRMVRLRRKMLHYEQTL